MQEPACPLASTTALKAGIPVVMLPSTVGGTPAATDLFTLFDDIIQRLTSVQG
ncbi:hypothetical protein [Thiothrix subterranea]|uniref:Uncharacterized protein n=1 Tax=Thiothrix subterranea TaxID=2735563 RepID=A0AA51MPX1_9GAMM|nr:hypothetical protein [Thiothrix subterranea]MDQ5769490.1 hypothetical protein [Thiothrix subterranea]WML86297.1 hypothetical protein RCG00_18635 [Thiothrix subterranea]